MTPDDAQLSDGSGSLRLFSRSPHPYHHRSGELLQTADRFEKGLKSASASVSASANVPTPARDSLPPPPPSLLIAFPFSLLDSAPASDSGTEADDEHFLKGLPAPRAKSHKGLRGMNEALSDVSTPLLSPAQLPSDAGAESGVDFGRESIIPRAAGFHSGSGSGSGGCGTAKARTGAGRSPEKAGGATLPASPSSSFYDRDKDRRHGRGSAERSRRRREIVRRSTELLLLVALGGLLCTHPGARPLLYLWRYELQATAAVVVGLVLLYPARLALFLRRTATEATAPSVVASAAEDAPTTETTLFSPHKQPPPKLAIPPSFDPAPLFYPLAVPVFVSLLLAQPTLMAAPLLNLVLCLCTLPKPLIPFSQSVEVYSPVQWLLSCVPVMVAEHTASPAKVAALSLSPHTATFSLSSPTSSFATPEFATLLYPLHQTLCWLLGDLTTTSLLPAELQLLSTALINLLLLAASPQAVILQALLWLGGLGLLVTSSRVVRWGVTLARVPRWRFRRPGAATGSGNNSGICSFNGVGAVLVVVGRLLAEILAPRRGRLERMFGPAASRRQHRLRGHCGDSSGLTDDEGRIPQKLPQEDGAVYSEKKPKPTTQRAADQSDSELVQPPTLALRHHHHHHLHLHHTTEADANAAAAAKTHTPSGRRKRTASLSVRAFFSLTHEQAVRRKWMYAAYLYASIAATVLVAIRRYVAMHALHGHEPFGWALGYLFGGLSWFRLEVVKANLEYWVCLPAREFQSPRSFSLSSFSLSSAGRIFSIFSISSSSLPSTLGWLEYVRQVWLGAANTRLCIVAYWLLILVLGLAVVLTLSPVYEVDTRRKVFHFMMVAMLLPATFVDPAFAALALALVLAVFLLLDLLRASQLPPLSQPLAAFLTPYVDGRDLRGPVVISHIFLLIGCAIPLWLSLAALPRVGGDGSSSSADGGGDGTAPLPNCAAGWELPTRDVSMVSGVICVGLGDAAASLMGRRWGRHKWLWGGGKSLEGSVAFAAAVFVGLLAASLWLRVGGWPVTGEAMAMPVSEVPASLSASASSLARAAAWIWDRSSQTVPRAGVCATMASLTEAVLTGGNDNVVVPVILWTCVKSLGL